jgi:hypothetical protein
VEAVLAADIDAGICWQPRVAAGMEIIRLARCPFIAMVPSGDDLARGASVALADLRGRRVLLGPAQRNPIAHAVVSNALSRAGVSPPRGNDPREYDELALGVVAGAGVALHPATIAAINRVPGVEFRPLNNEPDLAIDISVVHRSGNRNPRLRRVVDILGYVVTEALASIPLPLWLATVGGSDGSPEPGPSDTAPSDTGDPRAG